MNDIEKLAQLGGTLATVVVFIYYLTRKDKETKSTFDAFNKTIQNHLEHALKVELQISKALNNLTNCINTLSSKQENRNRTIDRRHSAEKE